MQPLDDDMDELFRRAGEEYPLNTNGSDWNKVLHQLQAKEEDIPKLEKGKSDYRYLWLLLLLPVGFVCGRYIGNSRVRDGVAVNQTDSRTSISAYQAKIPKSANAGNSTGTPPDTRNTIVEKTGNTSVAAKKADTAKDAGDAFASSAGDVNTISKTVRDKASGTKTAWTKIRGPVRDRKEHVAIKRNSSVAVGTYLIGKRVTGAKETSDGTVSSPSSTLETTTTSAGSVAPPAPTIAGLDTTSTAVSTDKNAVAPVAVKGSKNIKRSALNKGKLSYSFVIGPDLSTIKRQKTSGVGYSLGILVKYHFTKRLAVETGALWERKNYYTVGKYLDTNALKLPMHSIVNTVSGYCNMIELPVNIRYDFISRTNHSWFVSTGLSSYIMKNEDYNISYERYGQPYVKDYGYSNSTRDWFSILNLSAGYEKFIGKGTTISIAPYVKLPLRGIGIGKLPVSSTGIYFTISRLVK